MNLGDGARLLLSFGRALEREQGHRVRLRRHPFPEHSEAEQQPHHVVDVPAVAAAHLQVPQPGSNFLRLYLGDRHAPPARPDVTANQLLVPAARGVALGDLLGDVAVDQLSEGAAVGEQGIGAVVEAVPDRLRGAAGGGLGGELGKQSNPEARSRGLPGVASVNRMYQQIPSAVFALLSVPSWYRRFLFMGVTGF